jgi:hypothetical protein
LLQHRVQQQSLEGLSWLALLELLGLAQQLELLGYQQLLELLALPGTRRGSHGRFQTRHPAHRPGGLGFPFVELT